MIMRLLFVACLVLSLCFSKSVRAQEEMEEGWVVIDNTGELEFDPSYLPIDAEVPSVSGETNAQFVRHANKVVLASKPHYHSPLDVTTPQNFVRCRNAPSKEETREAMRQLALRFRSGSVEEDNSRDGRRFLRIAGEMRPRTIPKPGAEDNTWEAVASMFLRERCRSLGFKKGDVLIPSGPAQILSSDGDTTVMTVTFVRYYRNARVDGQTVLVNVEDSTVKMVQLVHHLEKIPSEVDDELSRAISKDQALEKLAGYFDEKGVIRTTASWAALPLKVGEPELTIGLRPTNSLPNPPIVAYVIQTPISIVTMNAVTGEIVQTTTRQSEL